MEGIPLTLAPYFPECDLSDIDPERDADILIERTLEYGDRGEVAWLCKRLGESRIKEFLRRRGARALSKRAFAFWCLVLRVEQWHRPAWAGTADLLWGR